MSVNRILAIGSAAILISGLQAGSPVFAQTDEDNTDLVLEEVTVTGTRIRGAIAPVGSSVINMTRDYIDQSPSISVDNLIREVPQVLNLGVTEATRDTSGGSSNVVYGNSVNLRGLGPYSTLVLLDSHRATTNVRNIEPSVIPSLALERVEILPDGASAIYGSDAVAGVVNLVLRRGVDGGKVVAQYGAGDNYDQSKVGMSWGTTWETGQFFGAIEYASHGNLSFDDRDFATAKGPGGDYRTNQCSPGTLIANGTSYAIPEGGVTPENAGSLVPGTRNLCEPDAGSDLLPKQDYTNLAFTFNQEISERIEFFADGFYSKRKFEYLPSYLGVVLTVPSSNAFFVDPTNSGLSSVSVAYSYVDDTGRGQDRHWGYSEAWEGTGGFKFALPADWQLEVLGTYGETREANYQIAGLNGGAQSQALASSDPSLALDPFGLHRTSDAVLQNIFSQLFNVDNTAEFTGAEVRVDGPVFKLPGGDVSVAAGYEYQDFNYMPSNAIGPPGTPYTCPACLVAGVDSLKRTVDSYYAEVLIPIFGEDNAVPGIQSLQIKAAVRRDDYSDVGGTTNPQYGINWEPLTGLTFRASYGESFRAPLITDLYGNSSALFRLPFPDPTIGGALRLGLTQSGGNPDLGPETATTETLGMDWEPEFLSGGRISLTYFDIDYENQIANYLGNRNVLFQEQIFEGTGIILRDEAAAQRVEELLAQGMRVGNGPVPDQVTLYVDGRPQNLGVSKMKGMDFEFSYNWSHSTGDYVFQFGGMYLTDYKVKQTPNSELEDRLNTIYNPVKLKLRTSLTWQRDTLGARLVLYHVNKYDNTLANPVQKVDSYNPVDLSAWIQLGDQEGKGIMDAWTLGLYANNVFDEDPPYVNIIDAYDATLANPIGRVLGLNLMKDF